MTYQLMKMKQIYIILVGTVALSVFAPNAFAHNEGGNGTVNSELEANRNASKEGGIGQVLQSVETNNKALKANTQLTASQKLAAKTENNLSDPTFSYSHLWGADNKDETIGELVVSQSFDFPSLYAGRGKLNRLRGQAYDAQSAALRQAVLLQAKELCLDLIMLRQQKQVLDDRLRNAEELSSLYRKRLEKGDANILETNKINLELLNVKTEATLNETALSNRLQELRALNGNQPVPFEDTAYPSAVLPADYESLKAEFMASDAAIQSLSSESAAAHKQISVSQQGWLPKLELGYRRNTESGAPFNGVIVGFSIPLFENKSKVKVARAQALNVDLQKEYAADQAESELGQLYGEAQALRRSMNEYEQTFRSQQDLSLLKQALTGGQISMIEYFVEVSVVYQSRQNYLQLENQYQKVLAKIYKGKL